jgi:hypothetical protein
MKLGETGFVFIVLVIFLTLIVVESSAMGAESDSGSRVIEGAKKEGALDNAILLSRRKRCA